MWPPSKLIHSEIRLVVETTKRKGGPKRALLAAATVTSFMYLVRGSFISPAGGCKNWEAGNLLVNWRVFGCVMYPYGNVERGSARRRTTQSESELPGHELVSSIHPSYRVEDRQWYIHRGDMLSCLVGSVR